MVWGNHNTARFPMHPFVFSPFLPQIGIPLAADDDDMGTRAVAVAFFIRADRKFRNMRTHGVVGQIKFHVGAALAPFAVIGEPKGPDIWHKIGGHEKATINFGIAVEVFPRFGIKAILKDIVVVINIIDAVKQIHDEGTIGHGVITRGL